MKILVVIINYGTKNDGFARRLIQEYQSMDHQVDIVALSNVEKSLGEGVEVRVVQPPTSDPWSFPFAHRQIMASRANDYDLFIYAEDDTLISQQNIEAFLWATALLPEDEIAGFLRSEEAPDGKQYFSTVHAHYRWLPESVRRTGEHTFAHYSNEHSGAYILTREQLRKAIGSGGFLVEPHEGRYDMLVSAATDPYTRCGLKKMICISRLADFVLPHLANKYLGSIGVAFEDVHRQIGVLLRMPQNGASHKPLFEPETKGVQGRWSKNYYEPARQDILALLPPGTHNVLSLGCGWGAPEELLVRAGMRVVAVPADEVIGACAAARGVEVISADLQRARAELAHERFDAMLLLGVLHLLSQPAEVLASFGQLVRPNGTVITTLPNFGQAPLQWKRLRRHPVVRGFGDFQKTGFHPVSRKQLRDWFRAAGMKTERINYQVPQRWQRVVDLTLGLGKRSLADGMIAVARRG